MRYKAKPKILRIEDDAELAWAAIAPIWDDLPLGPMNKLAAFLDDLTEGQRALIAIDWCQKEIRNGGIPQLLENTTGNLVPWAIRGFDLIGAEKYSAILSETSAMLGSEYPASKSARVKVYRALDQAQKARVDALENEFFRLLDSPDDDLEKYRATYVRDHSDQFVRGWFG